jgi:transcriptional regulator with XRE-family HTH domain
MKPTQQASVLGKDIERARREHKLSTTVLAMLAGLTDVQVQAIEEGSSAAFVNEAHRIDCARRIALAMGFDNDRFLQFDQPTVQPRRIVQHAQRSGLPRDGWEHLPVAALDVLSTLRATDLPAAAAEQRRGSPIVIALVAALALAGLMLALGSLH